MGHRQKRYLPFALHRHSDRYILAINHVSANTCHLGIFGIRGHKTAEGDVAIVAIVAFRGNSQFYGYHNV
jgi:hypothetical protein